MSARCSADGPERTEVGAGSFNEVGHIPFDHDAANLFFQLVASRYEQVSVILTS